MSLVLARPDRLQRFRTTARGVADGLAVRRGALGDAVLRYRGRTEAAFEADVADADDAVHALAVTVEQLGAWVGQVGDAFEHLDGVTVIDGVYRDSFGRLGSALPPALRLGPGGRSERTDDGDAGGGIDVGLVDALTYASAVGAGLHRVDRRAIGAVLGRSSAASSAGSAGSGGGNTGRGSTPVARFFDVGAALATAGAEAGHRWDAEPERPTAERAIRAGTDGLLVGAASGLASAGGAWALGSLCTPSVVAVPLCATAGSYLGSWLGSGLGEVVSDWILGDEPDPERDPDDVAAEIGDVDDEVLDRLGPVVERIAAAQAPPARVG